MYLYVVCNSIRYSIFIVPMYILFVQIVTVSVFKYKHVLSKQLDHMSLARIYTHTHTHTHTYIYIYIYMYIYIHEFERAECVYLVLNINLTQSFKVKIHTVFCITH